MFEPLEIIYASPLLMKVAFTAGLVAAVAFAATFLTMAIMDLRGDPVASSQGARSNQFFPR